MPKKARASIRWTLRLASLAASLVVPFTLLPSAVMAEGRGDRIEFVIHCQGCHLENGAGRPPDVPALRDRVGYLLQIPAGREYLVQVPGVSNAPVSDADLAGMLNYMVRTYAGDSMPTKFEPFSEAEVQQHRGTAPPAIDALRHRLWREIEARFDLDRSPRND